MGPDDDLPVVFDRAAARRRGVPDTRISRLVDAGVWTRLRRGQLTARAFADGELRWRAEVLAAARGVPRSLVLSHAHAARAWGLPTPLGGPGPLTFVAATGASRFTPTLVVRRAPLDDDETRHLGVMCVTSPARTVVDCARTLPPQDGLAIADAALRSGIVGAAEVDRATARARGWPGAVLAGRVLELASGRRETALESWSAWSFHVNAVPAPQWQVTVLRRLGLALVRWGARDVLDPGRSAALAEYLRVQIDRADPGRFLGRVILP